MRNAKLLDPLRKLISPDNPIRLAYHKLKAVYAAYHFGFPGRKMVMIGVTGTDGKTTTVHMTEHILRHASKKVAMMSTVEFRINGEVIPNKSKMTTMSAWKVQKFLNRCLREKVEYMIVECSSHSLHQSRLWGIPFSIAALTNVTHEHLDYHRTMEAYRDAKMLLFKNVGKTCKHHCFFANCKLKIENLAPHKQSFVLNRADRYYEDFARLPCSHKMAYGFGQGDIQVSDATYSKFGSRFALKYGEEVVGVDMRLPGPFNAENAMAATGIALACNVSLDVIAQALGSFDRVPGRMEVISSPRGFEVIVDFALTPHALSQLYATLRSTAPARIIGIIGSCGDRDKEKRPMMGKIVAENTDIAIVTDEEPYSEDPKSIMEAVYLGALGTGKIPRKQLYLIEDRYQAIEKAIQLAEKDDIVVVTGMGSFDTRTLNQGPVKWDEREVVKEIIAKN
jgi:UDP-N-acetylmuramoyl-L-alanyl-D-glutamate--2,6-diaminopimelate ligase